MKQSNNPIVIIGAGMSGMLAALFIKKCYPATQIIILEYSSRPGGHYKGLELEGFGYCDPAMRLIYETGIPELDQVIWNILPENEWQAFPDNEKDIAGIYWQGGLQSHSAYIDLHRLPEAVYRQCEKEILDILRAPDDQIAHNAKDYLVKRFGRTAAGYLIRVLEKFYHVPATALDVSATYQPAMNRVVLYGEDKMRALFQDSALRAVIAWPDQLTLPIKRTPRQCALYPKRFGINGVIEAMYCQLLEQGVRFLFNRQIESLEIKHNNIAAVTLDDGSRLEQPPLVIAANGLHAASKLLHKEYPPTLSAPPCWLVFLRVTLPPNMERLYHFYCFDEGYATFRVTHYYNYCPDAYDDTGYPLCIELWSNEKNAAMAILRAQSELRQMNMLPPDCRIVAQAAMRTHNLHALYTLEYVQSMRKMRAEVKQRIPGNMIAVGPFIEDGVMLLYEVWRDMHRKLIGFLDDYA